MSERPWWHEQGTCPGALERCVCRHEEGHDGPHVCSCGGSWNEDGSVVLLPTGTTNPLEAMARILGIRDDEDEE